MTRPNTPREVPQFFVDLPDGRRLSARLWLPVATPAPCILEYLPYRLRDGTAGRDETTHPHFAAAGYACLRVDIVGSGDSDALFDDEYSERELSDGEAVIAWAAAQAWCNGHVGMIGISWGGFNGLQLAARQPPALKAVVSVCSTVDRVEDDIHFMGGCLLTDNFNWGAQMTAYMTRPPDPVVRADWREAWLKRIEALPFSAANWLRRADEAVYWRHGSVRFDYETMSAAVLGIGGWADGYVNAPLALAATLGTAAALIGPWEHKYPHLSRIATQDFHAEAIGWFDRHLKGHDTPAPAAARLFVQEHAAPPDPRYRPAAGRWIALDRWPDPVIEARTLSLAPGALTDGPGWGEAVVDTPLSVGQGAAYWCPGMRVDNELCADQQADDAASLTFDAAPLDAPLEIIGRPILDITFTVDRPVAQLAARLCDVAPTGASMRITYRTRNLCTPDTETPDGPVVLPGTARMLEPGRRYTARIALNTCAHRVVKGHRLRLALSTSYWPVTWPAPEGARVTLDLAACRLHLPVHPGAPDHPGPGPSRLGAAQEGTVHRAPTGDSRRFEEGGALVLETVDDFGALTIPGHCMTTDSGVTQRFAIAPGDPLSAEHVADWRFALSRGRWTASIDSHARMTATATHFTLHRRVTAREGDIMQLQREWTETVPRGFL